MEQPQRLPAAATRNIVAETAELRVVEYTLQPGDEHPWHHHSVVTDRFYCLEGRISVTLRDTREKRILSPGETCAVPPGTSHRAGNAGNGVGRYLLVQGIGKYDFIAEA